MHELKNNELSITEVEQTSLPRLLVKKGPADLFDYNYRTNRWAYKIAAPIVKNTLSFLYKFKIEGIDNVPKNSNIIIMPNHVSHADSFFAVPPLKRNGPFHFIADEKLFKNKIFRDYLSPLFNVFPVRKRAKALFVVDHAIKKVKEGNSLLWYPEGQRHKQPWTNKLNPGKLGSGMIAHAVDVPVIPTFIAGAEFAMPVGKSLQFGKKLRSINVLVRYGKPVYLDDLRELPAGKETSMKVVNRIMSAIEDLRPKGPYKDQSHKL